MLSQREIDATRRSRPTVNKNEPILIHTSEGAWSGSGASKAFTISGVKAGDKVQATIKTAPTEAAYLKSATASANTVTITLSAANTSNDAVIAISVYR